MVSFFIFACGFSLGFMFGVFWASRAPDIED